LCASADDGAHHLGPPLFVCIPEMNERSILTALTGSIRR